MDILSYVNPKIVLAGNKNYKRRKSSIVNIGDVPMGGHFPIRVQSMTTTDTMDTEATIAQSISMIEAGCEYVRITAPSLKEAENLRNIKDGLRKRGYAAPLVADIHFTPNAAELAAKIVEKVRINPGNYVDKKKFEVKEYTDFEYEAELERIRKRFVPLVKICKENGTAMRIGTNHGSLSDRIMNRYGDTPQGMVESALEFLRICTEENYHQVVLSMKSSNPIVMIQAYRLLVASMDEENMHYPLHLGVTEAGEAEEGRVKSALGIGTLLEEGLGDTIRVSLTEPPEAEIPVAQKLASRYENRGAHKPVQSAIENNFIEKLSGISYTPYQYKRRETKEVRNIGGQNVPRVIADFSKVENIHPLTLKTIDYHYNAVTDKWNMGELGSDFIYFGSKKPNFMLPAGAKAITNAETWQNIEDKTNIYPLIKINNYIGNASKFSKEINFIATSDIELTEKNIQELADDHTTVLVISTENLHATEAIKQRFLDLQIIGIKIPVIIKSTYRNIDEETFLLYSATDTGALFADGFGDGIWLDYESGTKTSAEKETALINRTAFNILQASRTRISKTEYISCPSCGRTLFDLQETTAMIRERTDHLKGIKIAIMGCIVNGPGEMADADYGYVGTGPGKITLYRGKNVVKRNLASKFALDELISLIRGDGNWLEK